nr:MAG TPA: hypothetical protein [Caudoviricetes sp.]
MRVVGNNKTICYFWITWFLHKRAFERFLNGQMLH